MKAIVTGASSGIGRAVCQRLLSENWEVVGLARDFAKSPCDDDRFTAHPVDLADLDRLPKELQGLTAAHPQIDALVCSAGAGRFGDLEQFSYDQIRRLIDLNFTSSAFLARAYLPSLKRTGAGHLLFIGSEAALKGSQKGSIYCAAKFALRGFPRRFAKSAPEPIFASPSSTRAWSSLHFSTGWTFALVRIPTTTSSPKTSPI